MKDKIDPLLAGVAVALAFKDKKVEKKKPKKKFDVFDKDFDLDESINAHFDEDEDN